jgi:hypothetical protein
LEKSFLNATKTLNHLWVREKNLKNKLVVPSKKMSDAEVKGKWTTAAKHRWQKKVKRSLRNQKCKDLEAKRQLDFLK